MKHQPGSEGHPNLRLFRERKPPAPFESCGLELKSEKDLERTLSTVIEPSAMPGGATLEFQPPSGSVGPALEKLALVIPTLCEEESIGGLLVHVRSVLDPLKVPYEILVVDDDSPDGTGAVVKAISAADPRVRLVVRQGERGLSGAILYGWQRTDATILGVMDADGQHPPAVLPQLIEKIYAGRDMVIGSRYTPGGETGSWNPVRKLISATAVWVTWPLQRNHLRVKDPMSGLFMVRRHCLPQTEVQKTGFKLLLDLLVRGNIQTVTEVPFAFGLRSHGTSKANFKTAWDYGLLLARLYADRLGFGRQS